jgi:uncharacterized protein
MTDEPSEAPPSVTAAPKKTRPRRPKAPDTTAVEEPVGEPPEQGAAGAETAGEEFGSFVPVEVVDVVVRLPNPNPVLVLQTTDAPVRTFEIPIGGAEGISIANALHDVRTPKPLTHELFSETLTALEASVAVARVTAVEGGAFYAEIVVSGGKNGQRAIACRPSDAVAMALRQRPPAPIVASSAVLDAVSTVGDTGR